MQSLLDCGFKLITARVNILNIKYKKPKLNRQLYSQGASFVLGVFYSLCLDFWMNLYFTSLYCPCIECVVYFKCSMELEYLYTDNLSFMNFSLRGQHESAGNISILSLFIQMFDNLQKTLLFGILFFLNYLKTLPKLCIYINMDIVWINPSLW